MKHRFKRLLTENGWLEHAVIETDQNGNINSVTSESDRNHYFEGTLLPGFQNAHSHAFQYAMAGMSENLIGIKSDSFWTWREHMYRVALSVTPDELQEIAVALYREMVRSGYTAVAEFHYLHHDENGEPYGNRAEMGERLLQAASEAGINITLIPMFYQKGNFGKPAEAGQRRFISSTSEDYLRLLESSENVVRRYPNASLAMGVHSLRAVDEVSIREVIDFNKDRFPFHIHISEQLKEVDDCQAFYGKRPVEWLMENFGVNSNYHLVHATHLTESEVNSIARAGAHVVLCPSTEGNLGDGIFRFHDYKNAGGRWSIGTDSHIGLSPFEELRWLDYGQRLMSHRRDTFLMPGKGDAGFNAIEMAWNSGRRAMGSLPGPFFETGKPFNGVLVGELPGNIGQTNPEYLASTIIYTVNQSHLTGTFVNGQFISANEPYKATIPKRFRGPV